MSDRSSDELEPGFDPAILDAVALAPVPEEFAAGVLAAMGSERPTARRRGVGLAGGVLAAAVVLAIVAWPRSDSGMELASTRRSIELADRAVAVLEPGASLQWSDDDGDVVVQQTHGRVFYRVDRGGSFVVETPAGRVTVTGTCFEVEVTEMPTSKKQIAGLALGAAVAVATVYEGAVLVANERGEQQADAGERVVIRDGEAPRRADAGDSTATLAHAQTRIDGQRQRLRELERELESVRSQAEGRSLRADETPAQRAERCVREGGSACSWVEPSSELLDELADCGLAWVDHPAVVHGAIEPSPEVIAAAMLSPEEVQQLREVNEAYRELDARTHRELFLALGGDPALADRLSTGAIRGWLDAEVPRAAKNETSRLVAQERAGRRDVPEQIDDPAERYVRFQLDDGDRYEAFVADRLGAARARDLRLSGDGWPGNHSTLGEGCDGE